MYAAMKAPRVCNLEINVDEWALVFESLLHAESQESWRLVLGLARLSSVTLSAATHAVRSHYNFEDRQTEAFMKIVLGVGNLCLLGQAGSGKSYVLVKAVRVLGLLGASVVCTAPTRIAASVFNSGQTLAKALAIRPVVLNETVTVETCVGLAHIRSTQGNAAAEKVKNGQEGDEVETPDELWIPVVGVSRMDVASADVLLVDEAMTLSEFRFLQMLAVLKRVRAHLPPHKRLPLLVFGGDHMQTTPIPIKDPRVKSNLGKFCFDHSEFKRLFPMRKCIVELDIVKRASHQAYLKLLKALRSNKPLTREEVAEWHSITGPAVEVVVPSRMDPMPTEAVREQLRTATAAIVAHNGTPASRRGSQPKLDERFPSKASWVAYLRRCHPAKKRTYIAADTPDHHGNRVNALPREVELFVGMPVKAHVVDEGDLREAIDDDGSLEYRAYYSLRDEVRGVVKRMGSEAILVDTGEGVVRVQRLKVWRQYSNIGRPAVRTALPVVAEPALTVHGCQGRTYRHEHRVFVETPWERNQIYVALSRAVHPSLIRIGGSMANITNNLHESIIEFQRKLDAAMQARRTNPWVGMRL
jgi:hypothetical protein